MGGCVNSPLLQLCFYQNKQIHATLVHFLHFILHCTLYSSISRLHIQEIDSNFINQLLLQGIYNIMAMSSYEKQVVRQVYNTLHHINDTKRIDARFRFLKQQYALLVA